MVWNGVYIPLGYKYDLSVMMEDILVMLEKLGKSSSGMHKVHWPSNTFSSIWNLQWEENHLEIDTKWFSLVGYTEALLLQRSVLKIDKNSFTQEWKRLLGNILLALEECGYRSVMLPGMKRLERQHNIISGEGILYR
ncbi:MAG: hypothetical protein DRR16_29395 [Candidatus Parabeggiatoa sp. nov. 3]|nr:MAG: hypothetical protein DRR00_27065 [Gammaproteobacteria bacterium]RKZ59199.1 MAG: hypothetical protein DRQ99_24115 [Gammaproteobacteria bacterium]RKZ77571.1 MAG: hypothetical protein DRR16_29395 [Gammaproteobacteria bacterium]